MERLNPGTAGVFRAALEVLRDCAIVLPARPVRNLARENLDMAIRKCPACLTTAPMGASVAFTDDFVCAGCGQHLEVTEASRVLASTAGIAAGYFALSAAPPVYSTLGWAVPILYALLGYGCVSALLLMTTADLRLIPAPPVQAVSEPPVAHGGYH